MSGFTPTFQVVYLAAALAFFCVAAYLTRARSRRIVGALASVAVFTAMSAPIDMLAFRHEWWFYPSCSNPPHPPLVVYIGQALIFVGGVALVGWRVQRGFGARGLVAFVALFCGAGLARDMTVAELMPQMIRFGLAAPMAEITDLAAWSVVVLVALGVTRVVAGPAHSDVPRAANRATSSR